MELEREEKVPSIPHLAFTCRGKYNQTKGFVMHHTEKVGDVRLHIRPSLNPFIWFLARFRQKWVALLGNTEKTFLNIEVYKADWHCLRFLWLEDVHKPDSQTYSQVGGYHFCHVIFGLTASLFLLNVTLRYHTSSYKAVDPEFVKMIESFYIW